MKKFFRLNVGILIARAIYASREKHWADIQLLKKGVWPSGLALTKREKLAVVEDMLKRLGRDTSSYWLPPVVLLGLTKILKPEEEPKGSSKHS